MLAGNAPRASGQEAGGMRGVSARGLWASVSLVKVTLERLFHYARACVRGACGLGVWGAAQGGCVWTWIW